MCSAKKGVSVSYTNLFAVLRVGEVNEVIIVHLLGVDDVTVLLLTQVLWVDSIGSEKLLVGHAEGLTYGLSNELGLKKNKVKQQVLLKLKCFGFNKTHFQCFS